MTLVSREALDHRLMASTASGVVLCLRRLRHVDTNFPAVYLASFSLAIGVRPAFALRPSILRPLNRYRVSEGTEGQNSLRPTIP